jgi:predicted membrane protein
VKAEYDRSGQRELAGLVIIVIGFALLLNSMNILPFGPIVSRFWMPVLFIGIGLFQLSRTRGHEGRVGGLFFILFGTLFLISRLNVWDISFGKMIGPAILIWIGVSMLIKRSRPRHVRPHRPGSFGMEQFVDSSDYIHASAFLGGFNRKCASQQFRGGDLTAFMGGGKVDLRDAQMQSDEAEIEVFAMMGGIEIQIPTNWVIEQRFTPILGGIEDKTHQVPGSTKRLALHGTAIMGGISVTN